MKDVTRRDVLQVLASTGSLGLVGCGDGSEQERLGNVSQAAVVHPRAYITTHTLQPGGTLQWCASYGTTVAAAHLRVIKVTGLADVTNPTTNIAPVVATSMLLPAASIPFNGEEIGYGWSPNNQVLPADITPGLYAAQWSADGVTWAGSSVAYFVVRPMVRAANIVLCLPFATIVAYAGEGAGVHKNIYDSAQFGRNRKAAIDRPWDKFAFGGDDKRGRTVRYPFLLYQFVQSILGNSSVELCTSFDLHDSNSILNGYKLFLSAGHDEYWSKEMRDRVQAFVAAGGNAAFFSANTAWWQVRFSGRTMVCYKNSVEDPLAGVDNARVTSHFCASPVDTPENTLTGVSFRRGIMSPSAVATPFTIKATGHDYFAGVTGTTFGAGLMAYETDACEYDTSDFQASGRDGSPLNLKVLALADLSADESAGQKGQATMTEFTNGGIVFSAATTEWCNKLADADVAQITSNVLNILQETASPLKPAWSLPSRVNPAAAWSTFDSVAGAGVALAGVVQGHLLRVGTNVQRRDPETPSVGWSSSMIPTLAGLTSLGSDYWGQFLFAGTSTGTIFRRSSRPESSAGWAQSVAPPIAGASCLGIGAIDDVYALFGTTEPSLYRRAGLSGWLSSSWERIGVPFPKLKTITAFDAKLFGVGVGTGATDDLFCRENSPVDLVWTKIGSMPSGMLPDPTLAAYYGRLFTLTGTTASATLRWRAAIADSAGMFKPPSLLFLNAAGSAVGTLSGNGDVELTGVGGAPPSYTKVARANNGLVFFYHSNGSAAVCRYNANGTRVTLKTWAPASFGAWTSIAYVYTGDLSGNNEKVIFHNASGTSETYIGRFDTITGDFITEWHGPGFAAGWSHIVCTNAGKLCFYNAATGAFAWGKVSTAGVFTQQGSATGLFTNWQVVVPAGNRNLFFYKATGAQAGTAALAEVDAAFTSTQSWNNFSTNLMLGPAANGALLFYTASSGGGVAGGFSASTFVPLRDFPAGAFGTGWTNIVPLPALP
jgi:hypothetical protein